MSHTTHKNLADSYGISRNHLQSICMNEFHFPQQFLPTLSQYFILHWEGEYLMDRLEEGTLNIGGIDYLIIYQSCNAFSARRASHVRLSFRKAKSCFRLEGYVIVRTDLANR